jgi:hypothetical protein
MSASSNHIRDPLASLRLFAVTLAVILISDQLPSAGIVARVTTHESNTVTNSNPESSNDDPTVNTNTNTNHNQITDSPTPQPDLQHHDFHYLEGLKFRNLADLDSKTYDDIVELKLQEEAAAEAEAERLRERKRESMKTERLRRENSGGDGQTGRKEFQNGSSLAEVSGGGVTEGEGDDPSESQKGSDKEKKTDKPEIVEDVVENLDKDTSIGYPYSSSDPEGDALSQEQSSSASGEASEDDNADAALDPNNS